MKRIIAFVFSIFVGLSSFSQIDSLGVVHDVEDNIQIKKIKLPGVRVAILPIGRFEHSNAVDKTLSFFNVVSSAERLNFQYGLLTYFTLPRVNSKVFLRTGVLTNSQFQYVSRDDYDILVYKRGIKVPLQFCFEYMPGQINPFWGYGLSFYSAPEWSLNVFPSISMGVNAKITNLLFATLSADIDYRDPVVFFMPTPGTQLMSYAFNLGFGIRF